MHRRAVIAVLAAMCLGVFAASAAAGGGGSAPGDSAGPTMEGEDLFGLVEDMTLTADCHTNSVSSVSWTASGLASGPFPGTFSVSGTLTVGPQTVPGFHPPDALRQGTVAGPVLSFHESFSIESGTTTITGTKTLLPEATIESGTLGTCQEVSRFPVLDFFDGQGRVVEVNTQTHYEASIDGPGAPPSSDSGLAATGVSQNDITGNCPAGICQARIGGFTESFLVSDQTPPPPPCEPPECDRRDD